MKERWMVVGTLALLVIAGQLLADNDKKEKDAPKKTTYKYVALTIDGEEKPHEDMFLTLTGNEGVVTKGGEVVVAGTFQSDKTKTPWTIDLNITAGLGKGELVKGIYEIKGGTMTACFAKAGKDRPTAFNSTKKNEHLLEVLEEAKPVKYKYVSAVDAGEKLPKEKIKDWMLTVTGDQAVWSDGDKVMAAATFKSDRTKTPWTVDLHITEGEDKGKVVKGIFEIKDGTMTACSAEAGKERPTKFSSTKENGHRLSELQEVK
jgi:uncharacterized protein (TIGR03067 family)